MSRTTRRRAFTLVELLVVLGIIAVLVALLMPALTAARRKALELRCATNLRTLGQALIAYVSRHGYYPGCTSYGVHPGNAAIWPTRLRQVTDGNFDLFNCPAADEEYHWKRGAYYGPLTAYASREHAAYFGYEVGEPLLWMTSGASRFTYGYNLWGTGDRGGNARLGLGAYIAISPRDRATPHDMREIPSGRVRRPSDMIAIADSTMDGRFDFGIDASGGILGEPPYGWPGRAHRGGANVLFCDGHVTWHAQAELVDFSGPQGKARRRMWHNDHEP